MWEVEVPIIVRTLINDMGAIPTYSDERINQAAVVAGQYVQQEVNLSKTYTIDILEIRITPDPSVTATRDNDFISFLCLRTACLLDQSTFRTKAALEGIKTALGPANLSVGGNLAGYKTILDQGPCALYDKLMLEYNIGNASAIQAVLSPFVGNTFDPAYLGRGFYRNAGGENFYS